jgi:type I restriction enzyme, S subunit
MSSEWFVTSLAEFANINPKRPITKGSIAPFIEMAALPTYARDIPFEDVAERVFAGGGSKFTNGDTLLARITPCLENGKTARVSCLPNDVCGHGSTEFIVLAPRLQSDEDFLYYLARSDEFRTYAISRMEGTSGRQRVPNGAVGQYAFLCPPANERKEIGDLFRSLDDRISLLRETNITLEAIAQALFKSWFVDFDPVRAKQQGNAPQGMDTATAALFPDSFEESELGEVPKGWRVKSLDTIAEYLNGLALQKFPPEENNWLPVIKISQLRKGDTTGADRANRNLRSEYIIQNGDVLFSWSGSLEVIIWCGGEGALNQHLFKVTSVDYPKWFYYLWTKHHLANFQQIAESKATTMGHIQRKHLTEAKVVVPPADFVAAANAYFEPLTERWIATSIQAQTLATLRDTLLPRLISGQLRLPT